MEHGFKEGDLVKVVRKPSREELDDWTEDMWLAEMDCCVDSVGRVECFEGEQTVCVRFEWDGRFYFGYPVFSLEKVNGYWDKRKGGPVLE